MEILKEYLYIVAVKAICIIPKGSLPCLVGMGCVSQYAESYVGWGIGIRLRLGRVTYALTGQRVET